MHKHRTLVDEIFCQIVKQITDNKSIKTDSVQRGWKLLAVILNYFIPSEHLQPYVVEYLQNNRNQCSNFGKKFVLNFINFSVSS